MDDHNRTTYYPASEWGTDDMVPGYLRAWRWIGISGSPLGGLLPDRAGG